MTLDVLVDGLSHRFGGGVTYLAGLLPALVEHPLVGRVRLLVEPGAALQAALRNSDIQIEEVRLWPPGRLAPRAIWEAVVLPRDAAGSVLLAPSAMLPRRLAFPVVAVPHNALPFEAGGLRNTAQRWVIVRTLGWASGAIFVSGYMRDLVSAHCRVPIVNGVVHHGVSDAFSADLAPRPRMGIVCVADVYPHKRLDLLVAAWRLLGDRRPPLRLIGRQMSASFPAPEPGLHVETDLSADQVADALRSAQLAVLPSDSESFGLPAVEALACGTPLVTSDIPAYREVTGGHATLISGHCTEHWSNHLRSALESPVAMDAARAWAKTFTWSRCADATAALLQESVVAHGKAIKRS